MDIMKREIKIFISVVLLMLVGASAVFAATSTDMERPLRVHNEGFEAPVITREYEQPNMDAVPYWKSTAYEKKIEIFQSNKGTYIPNTLLVPRAGKQAAELNADEESTLYQYVYGDPGSVYEWGVSHRARRDGEDNPTGDKDTMAIFIGPKQPFDPKKTAKAGKDQFMKTVDWLERHISDLKFADLKYGDCRAFEVFTTKFAANGKFEGETDSGYDNAISLTQTDTHTEKWQVWIVVSSKDSWYDYGVTAAEDCAKNNDGYDEYAKHYVENSSYPQDKVPIRYKMPDYNYRYTVPATSTNGTIYAYCAYDVAYTGNSKLTHGNMVDYARMGIISPVRVTSTEGGRTDVTLNTMSAEVTSYNQFSTETAAGNNMSLVIKPDMDESSQKTYTFIGAYINNEWKSSSDSSTFTPNDDGTYTLSYTVEDGMNSIHIIFAKHPYIIHSPNGGTYQGTNQDIADEIEGVGTKAYTGEPTAIGDARFTYWEIAGENVNVGADHTVDIAAGSEQGKYNITVKDSAGNAVKTINDTDIVVFIAHYEHPQTVNIYTKEKGKWALSDAGGSVSIKYNNQTTQNTGATTTIYVEDNTTVTVTANANAEYSLERIVSNDTVTTENVFMFYSAGERVVSVYFMSSEVGAVVSYVDEFNNTDTDYSYVLDTNTGKETKVSNVGGVYGNTVSTAFTGFWEGDENTYTYVQWAIHLPFDTDTILKKNGIIGNFGDVKVEDTPYKTDTEAVNSKFRGGLYRCVDGNTGKQLIMNFPTVFTGASSIYSTIILDGIYSPNATAKLRSITEINAAGGNQLDANNGFSVGLGKSSSEMSYKSAENNYYVTEYSEEQGNEKN